MRAQASDDGLRIRRAAPELLSSRAVPRFRWQGLLYLRCDDRQMNFRERLDYQVDELGPGLCHLSCEVYYLPRVQIRNCLTVVPEISHMHNSVSSLRGPFQFLSRATRSNTAMFSNSLRR